MNIIEKIHALLAGADGNLQATVSKLSPKAAITDPAKIQQLTQSVFQECVSFVCEEENRILKELSVANISQTYLNDLAKQSKTIQAYIAPLIQIAQSKLSQTLGNVDQSIETLKSQTNDLANSLEAFYILQSLKDQDPNFKKDWGVLHVNVQNEIIELFKNVNSLIPVYDAKSKKDIQIATLQILLELHPCDPSEIRRFFMNFYIHFDRTNHKEIIQLQQDYFECLRKVKQKQEVLNAFTTLWSRLDTAKIALRYIQRSPENAPEYASWISVKPESFLQLLRWGPDYRSYGSLNAEKTLAKLFQLGPDAECATKALFQYTNLSDPNRRAMITPENIPLLEKFFEWLNEQTPSEENKIKLCYILDRMVALFLDNHSVAMTLLKFPKADFKMLYTILNRDDILNLTPQIVAETLTKEGDVKLAESILDNTAYIKSQLQSAQLQTAMNNWLDIVLVFNSPSITTPNTLSLDNKIKALPNHYQDVVNKMMQVSANRPKVLLALLEFAKKCPFSLPLSQFLTSLSNTKIENEFKIKAVQNLVTPMPDALPQILSLDLSYVEAIGSFLNENPLLFRLLIKKYPKFLEKYLIELEDKNLQDSLLYFLELEAKTNLPIFTLFEKRPEFALSRTLKHFISQDPQLAIEMAFVLNNSTQINPKKRNSLLILDSLKQYPNQTVDIIKTLSNYPVACLKEIQELQNNQGKSSSLMTPELSDNIGKLAFLMTVNEDELKNSLIKSLPTAPSRVKTLIDMAYSQYFPEVKTLLTKLNDKDPLTQKIFSLVESGKYDLVCKILKLDPKTDHELLTILLEKSEALFINLLLLKEQGDKNLLPSILKSHREPNMKQALDAIQKGHFQLAKEIITQPYLSVAFFGFSNVWAYCKSRLPVKQEKLFSKILIPFIANFSKDDSESFQKWMAKVQFLLQYDSEKLFNILSKRNWQKIDDDKVWDISKEIGKILKFDSIQMLTQSLATCLLTPKGEINSGLIPILLKHPKVQKIQTQSYDFLHIIQVLETLKEPYFNERLQTLTTIPYPSRQHQLLSNTNKPIETRDLRVGILSALLWPLRQGDAGSCFGTSVAIQNASTFDGLKQIFEDLISVTNKGYIVRTSPDNGTVEHPLVVEKGFPEDNLLARAYESTISSMASTGINLKSSLLQKWDSLFKPHIAQLCAQFKHAPEPSFDTMYSEFQKVLAESCSQLFVGSARHPLGEFYGAWGIYDNKTGNRLDEPGAAFKFYMQVFQDTQARLKARFPNEIKLLEDIFTKQLMLFIQNEKFTHAFYEKPAANTKGLLLVNPIKYAHLEKRTPYVYYIGGLATDLVKSFHGYNPTIKAHMPNANPYETYYNSLNLLSNAEKDQVKSGKRKLMLVSHAHHSFNFQLDEAYRLFSKRSPKVIWEDHLKQINEIENTPLTTDIAQKIVEAFLNAHDPEIKNQLKSKFNKEKSFRTIRELCDFLTATHSEVTGNRDEDSYIDDQVESAIRDLPQFDGKFPKIHRLYDINWIDTPHVGFGMSVYSKTIKRMFPKLTGNIFSMQWNFGKSHEIRNIKVRERRILTGESL